MWTYSQSKGELRNMLGELLYAGYSGQGEGKNNPAMQGVKNVGPIPRGHWAMTGTKDSSKNGPFCIVLAPTSDTNTLGRSGFLIHGDSAKHPGEASEGCIILPRRIRESVWASGDTMLEVIA